MRPKTPHNQAAIGRNWPKMSKFWAVRRFRLEVERGSAKRLVFQERHPRLSAYDASFLMLSISRFASVQRRPAFVFQICARLRRFVQFFLVSHPLPAHGCATHITKKGKKACLTNPGSSQQSQLSHWLAAWKTTQSARWLAPAQAVSLAKPSATTTVLKAPWRVALSARWLTTSKTTLTSARSRALFLIDHLRRDAPQVVFLLKDAAHV